jgi:hypothetical protein
VSGGGYVCGMCGVFVPSGQPHYCPSHLRAPAVVQGYPFPPAPPPMGCICPPGANLACESPRCPRKATS